MSNFYIDVIKKDKRFKSTQTIKDISLLEPGTRAAVAKLIVLAHQAGHEIRVAETYRSQSRQTQVFKAGASELSKVGCHGYGLACDLGLYHNGVYDAKGEHYEFFIGLCKQVGLVSGIDWGTPNQNHTFHDWDHVQRIPVFRQNEVFAGTWYPPVDYDPYKDTPPLGVHEPVHETIHHAHHLKHRHSRRGC